MKMKSLQNKIEHQHIFYWDVANRVVDRNFKTLNMKTFIFKKS